mgnify:CR=1 FL=1
MAMNIPGYKIIELIKGEGGKERFLATQVSTGRPVVIKTLAKSLFNQAALGDGLQQFLKDGESAKYISHPNIAQLHDVGHTDEVVYSIVDYVSGDTLQARAQKMCLLDKIYVIKQLAGALDYLAERNMGHFNIRPANIILCAKTSRAILTDFGFARDLYPGADLLLQAQQLEFADYVSPEQLQKESLDIRADLYSLGAIFCFLLTGRAPFKKGAEAVGTKHIGVSFVELPRELSLFQGFIDYALAKMPQERFQSGREMIEELDNIDDEAVIALEGYQADSGKAGGGGKKGLAGAGSNVVSLASVLKKKKVNFHELLRPKEEEPVQLSPEEEALCKTWQDVPPTEFNNSYEILEDGGVSWEHTQDAVTDLFNGPELGAEEITADPESSIADVSGETANVASAAEMTTDDGAATLDSSVAAEPKHRPYQSPIEGPWPPAEPGSGKRSSKRRTFLLALLLLASALFYYYYQ